MLLLGTGLCAAQTSATPCKAKPIEDLVAGEKTTGPIAKRENALHPAMYAEACRDYQRAYDLFQKVLAEYPKDGRVLMLTAEAAVAAGKLEDAIPLLQHSLAMHDEVSNTPYGRRQCTWSERMQLMGVYFSLKRWPEYEDARQETRKAAREGDQCLSVEKGYPIDTIQLANEFVKVIELPVLDESEHIRNRFDFYEEKDPCTGFTPHADLVWDGEIPKSAETQHFTLTMYATPESPVPLKSYIAGEPEYHILRTDFETLMKTRQRPSAKRCTTATP